jgi:hypothetical protein
MPVKYLLTWEEGKTNDIVSQRAEDARVLFEELGLKYDLVVACL